MITPTLCMEFNVTSLPLAATGVPGVVSFSPHTAAYLHVPKTGSGMQNLFFRASCRLLVEPPFLEPHEVKRLEWKHCPKVMRRHGFGDGHAPAKPRLDFQTKRSGLVTMLRRPWRRALSGFFHKLHDCRELQIRYGILEGGRRARVGDPTHIRAAEALFYANASEEAVLEYAKCVSACATNMLTGYECGDTHAPANLDRALQLLPRLAFVGITEEWNTTLETFARRFAVPLVARDYATMRRQRYFEQFPSAPRVASQLMRTSFVDDALYEKAVELLHERRGGNALR